MGSWAGGVHGSWTGQMMGYRGGGGFMIFWEGAQALFFLFSENFTCSKKIFLGAGGAWAPFGINVGLSLYIYIHTFLFDKLYIYIYIYIYNQKGRKLQTAGNQATGL